MKRQTLFNYGVVEIRGEAATHFCYEGERIARENIYTRGTPQGSYGWHLTSFMYEVAGMTDGSLMAEANRWFREYEDWYKEGGREMKDGFFARLNCYKMCLRERGLLLSAIGWGTDD
jgi:hypothetical protein